jgi:uncharacterized membrane protein YqjE
MSDANTDAPPAPPAQPSLARFGAAGLGLLHGHIELLGLELQEQKSNSLQALALTALTLLAGWLLLLGLSALLLIALWDDYRLQAISGLCLFYALLLLASLWRLRKLLNSASNPFSASLYELARDRERLLP